jgi:hypothetical protein
MNNKKDFSNIEYLLNKSIDIDALELIRVSTYVNSTKNDDFKCIQKYKEKNSITNYFTKIKNEDNKIIKIEENEEYLKEKKRKLESENDESKNKKIKLENN